MAISFKLRRSKDSKLTSTGTEGIPPVGIPSVGIPSADAAHAPSTKLIGKFKRHPKKTRSQAGRFKFIKKTAFVLLIGDDGAILVLLRKGMVEGRWFAPEPKEEHFEVFNRAVLGYANVPCIVFLDTLDQAYLQQNLPPVNRLGVQAIIKRRLKREFGGVEIKGARLLGHGKDKKDWLFQLISADTTDNVVRWFDWISTTPNRCAGVRLLPLEMESVLQAIYWKTKTDLNAPAHSWLYLLSHQKVSGFRQVILHDGKMIFTRVGQTLQGATDVIAGLVEQEISSTIEYLKRLGLHDMGLVHLHIVASQDVLKIIDPTKTAIKSVTTSTPHQAAELLGLENATQPADRYGDIVTAAAAARLKKPTFNILTTTQQQLAKLHQAVLLLRVAPVVIVMGLIVGTGMRGYTMWAAYDQQLDFERKKQEADQDFTKVKKEMAELEDIDKIKDVMDVLHAVQQKELGPESFLLRLSTANHLLGDLIKMDVVTWSVDNKNPSPQPQKEKATASVNVTFFPKNTAGDEGTQKEIDALVERIRPLFNGYEVTLSDLKGIKSASDSINLDFSRAQNEAAPATPEEITAKLTFIGNEPPPQPTTPSTTPSTP